MRNVWENVVHARELRYHADKRVVVFNFARPPYMKDGSVNYMYCSNLVAILYCPAVDSALLPVVAWGETGRPRVRMCLHNFTRGERFYLFAVVADGQTANLPRSDDSDRRSSRALCLQPRHRWIYRHHSRLGYCSPKFERLRFLLSDKRLVFACHRLLFSMSFVRSVDVRYL